MFTLVYINRDHEPTGPVLERDTASIGEDAPMGGYGELSMRHMTTARRHALIAAQRAECDVLVMAGGKPRLLISPDGSAKVPPGMKPPPGPEHAPNERGVCFCMNCRAARRGN